jgi:hypothetical protein
MSEREVSPTVFRVAGFRYFFFSREEPRMHVHVRSAECEAKYWLEPAIELAENYRLRQSQLKEIEKTIRARYDELVKAWKDHFGS